MATVLSATAADMPATVTLAAVAVTSAEVTDMSAGATSTPAAEHVDLPAVAMSQVAAADSMEAAALMAADTAKSIKVADGYPSG
jgi:hypothetical protein